MADLAPELRTDDLEQRMADASALLEAIHQDRGILARVEPEVRQRLLIAAGYVSRPSRNARRAQARAGRRVAKERRRDNDDAVLAETGIRATRRQKVFPTPTGMPPALESAEWYAPDLGPDLGPNAAPGVEPGVEPEIEINGDTAAEPRAPAAASDQAPRRVVIKARNCYICKRDFHELHFFYDAMCAECADFNWHKRHQSADLSGRVALMTGARVKIGYQAGIKLLRAGAHLIVTTRFPRDAAIRYASEDDFPAWRERLQIYGLDLRHTPSVELFARNLRQRLDRLDFIVSNACQTVRRPPGFYRHLMDEERRGREELADTVRALLPEDSHLGVEHSMSLAAGVGAAMTAADGLDPSLDPGLDPSLDPGLDPRRALAQPIGLWHSAELSQIPLVARDLVDGEHIFPTGQLDADLQQVDLRDKNSWRLTLAEVPTVELLEVQLVNAVAPFVLNGMLKPLMLRHDNRDKHIVNVSAVEGQFYRRFKTDKHPHTNMAKAALNMMTRTSAVDYHKDGIHMNSVDTGWVTDEDPAAIAARKQREHGFHPPLDIVDGAARILDPIFHGVTSGEHAWGKFFKDYRETDW